MSFSIPFLNKSRLISIVLKVFFKISKLKYLASHITSFLSGGCVWSVFTLNTALNKKLNKKSNNVDSVFIIFFSSPYLFLNPNQYLLEQLIFFSYDLSKKRRVLWEK